MEFIKTYFTAEKSESLIFIAFGILTISFSAYALLKWGETFHKGFSIPLILIGLIQVVIGGTVYFRTDKQVSDLEILYRRDRVFQDRSEEHTSELQSQSNLVCRLLLEKKKHKTLVS